METKFIGVEGFNEIESITACKKSVKNQELNFAQKSVRFVKRASKLIGRRTSKKFRSLTAVKSLKRNSAVTDAKKRTVLVRKAKPVSVIERHYNENRSSSELNGSVREAISGVFARNTVRGAHSAPKQTRKNHNSLRKKAVPAVAASVLAVSMTCITAAGALTAVPESVNPASPTNYDDYIDKCGNDSLIYSATSASTADEAFGSINDNAYASITSALISSNIYTHYAGLYVDGVLIGAASDVNSLNAALEQVLVDYRKDYDDTTTTEFVNDVEVKEGKFEENDIMKADEIVEAAKDKFSISLSTDMIYTRTIPYESIVEYDSSKPSSYEEVKTEGVNGEEEVTLRTTFTDGVQTDAVQTDSKIVAEAVNEVVVKGGSEEQISSADGESAYSSGSFIWPLPYTHNITSTYGARWGTIHGGIDISSGGVYGQEIVASDSGTVVFAGNRDDGYGYYVIIDHGNGYQTYYAHCSSLAVSAGQTVAQGQTISYVGSTGDSTGPHLHFEIRIDGERTDPLGYVG